MNLFIIYKRKKMKFLWIIYIRDCTFTYVQIKKNHLNTICNYVNVHFCLSHECFRFKHKPSMRNFYYANSSRSSWKSTVSLWIYIRSLYKIYAEEAIPIHVRVYVCVCMCMGQCLSDSQASTEWTGAPLETDSQLNDWAPSNQVVTFPLKLQWYEYLTLLYFYWYLSKLKDYNLKPHILTMIN